MLCYQPPYSLSTVIGKMMAVDAGTSRPVDNCSNGGALVCWYVASARCTCTARVAKAHLLKLLHAAAR